MTTATLANVNSLGHTYLRNQMNSNFNIYGSGRPLGLGDFDPSYINTAALLTYSTAPSVANIGSSLPNSTISTGNMVTALRQAAYYYAQAVQIVYGLIGVTSDFYHIGFVNTAYHSGRYSNLVGAINTRPFPEMSGNVTQNGIIQLAARMFSLLYNSQNNTVVDLRVCHSSCHSSCHGSRGRR